MVRMYLVAALTFAAAVVHGHALVSGIGTNAPANYQQVLLSNGRLTATLNFLGGVDEAPKGPSWGRLTPGLYRIGRRIPVPHYDLYGHGAFRLHLLVDGVAKTVPDAWSQYLDLDRAVSGTTNVFGAVTRSTEAFIAADENTLAIRQRFTASAPCRIEAGIDFWLPGDDYILSQGDAISGDERTISFKVFGRQLIESRIVVKGGRPRAFMLQPGETRTVDTLIFTADSLDGKDWLVRRPTANIDALLARHETEWRAYYAESSIDLPDDAIMRMWKMANYHLKCSATEWSIPVGLIPSHWNGKIFPFDEMYGVQGLISAGHVREAMLAPKFRFNSLPDAMARCLHRHSKRFFGYGARWVWQSLEDSRIEGSSLGFWLDHIFHMSAIAQTCWVVYRYTGDLDYLRATAYPVMRECARFYRSQWVCETDGGAFIAPCTDLERLGPGRVRPFMTTCGVIHTFRTTAEAAKLLGTDAEEAADLMATAERLERLLPVADGRFIPSAEDAGAVSMGTLAGYFPFPVFPRGHMEQTAAVAYFLAQGVKGGNMYPRGKMICPWYAGTMSVAALLSGVGKEPVAYLHEAAKSAGCWDEFWEINEPGVAELRPWFMTAAGNCLYAICSILVCEQDGVLRLGGGVPATWGGYSFRLPAPGGLMVDCAVDGGRLARLSIGVKHPSSDRSLSLLLPSGERRSIPLDRTKVSVEP